MVDVSRNVVAVLLVLVIVVSGFGTLQWLRSSNQAPTYLSGPAGDTASVQLTVPPRDSGNVALTVEGSHG